MQTQSFSISARPLTDAEAQSITVPMRAVQMGDTLFVVTADGPEAARLLEALDPLNVETLRDRIGALLERGSAILADMAEREATAAS